MTQTAAIIAIGTEVSSGEIMNSNASWLAARLDSCGIDVILHLAVADDRQSILDALDFASARATHVLTIGGLGPTTDDFTRDVITAWAGLTTSFDEPSWKRIEDRFQKFGRTAPQSNRQQCFFPEGSRILLNSEGSANGFSLRARNTRVTVLPGPPRELQAIWKDHLDEEFHNLGATGTKPRLLTWACLGVPESTLAEQVESIMAGSDLQLGYRASAPMVHVKVWIPKGEEEKSAPFIDKLNKALEPVCVARDGADPLASLKATLSAQRDSLHVTLDDSVTGGLLASRLADLLRPLDIPFSLTSSHRHSDATRHSERSEESSLPRHSE
ncbi:competence/damage-inducible protein A, partial [bacterium]|nr:competence/damage-inducible protein A [bacterium]